MSENQATVWQDRFIKRELLPAGELAKRFNILNPRLHPEAQRDAVEESLETLGWIDEPILSTNGPNSANLADNPDAVLKDGHLRIELALLRGGENALVPVNWYFLTEKETELALNTQDPTSEMAVYDPDKLADLLERTRALTADRPGLGAMLQKLKERAGINGHQKTEDNPPSIDKAADLQKKWQVKLGDVFELGQHRLVCGDCTDRATVEAVMRGERAEACITDSPYGMGVEGIANDDEEGLLQLFRGTLAHLPIDNGIVVNCQGARLFWVWMDAVREFKHKIERALWLYKPNDGTYPWRGWLQTGQAVIISSVGNPKWATEGEYKHDTYVINFVGTQLEKLHATPKPLEMVSHIVSWVSLYGGIIYDPFVGSGTTIIAAESLGRKVRAIEISPPYVAVCLQRFLDATGIQPTKPRAG